MAVSFVAWQEWAAINGVADIQISLPNVGGTLAAGDRVYVFATWKTFSITATVDSNSGTRAYTEITEFADGSVAAGNGTGSMKVGAWYKDWVSDDDGPTIHMSSTTSLDGGMSALGIRKGASETWDEPTFATAAWPSSSSQTVSASSSIAVPSGGIVMAEIGIRDDSATFTRGATTGIDVASGITWAADYVEAPSSHFTTTVGNDLSADTGYRLVTTGATVTLRVTATISAAETGSVLWVAQGSTAAAAERVPKYQPMVQLLAH